MTLKVSGMLGASVIIQYICTLEHSEVLRKFEILSAEVVITTLENLEKIILGLSSYFFPVNALSNKKSDASWN